MTQELTLIERAQQALRGEEPWEPIMGRIHAFVRGDLDAEIAALTERLRITEAERDALRRATGDNRKGDAVDEITLLKRELSALRAELERKDAALQAERQCAENFAEQFAECQWIDMGGYFEVRGPVTLMLDSEFAEQAYTARRAALQPKEPPCKA